MVGFFLHVRISRRYGHKWDPHKKRNRKNSQAVYVLLLADWEPIDRGLQSSLMIYHAWVGCIFVVGCFRESIC